MKVTRFVLALASAMLGVCPLIGAAPFAGAVAAQLKRELVGIVRDPAGAALEGATVEAAGNSTLSDARGSFQLFTGAIDTVTIFIKRVGYLPIEAQLTARNKQWDTVVVQMERNGQRLSEVNVKETMTRRALGLRGFEERKSRGNGLFITREDIVTRNSSRVSDVLRNKRGVNIIRGGKVRFVAHTGSRGTLCQPDIWLDGTRVRGMEVDDIFANTVEAIELYENFSTIPFEFTPHDSNVLPCGTIVIWSRVPNSKER
ncbi:MAG: carboxypeptidase regulatory-like domain-containing protein [Gemmatimonadaceae bacterium]